MYKIEGYKVVFLRPPFIQDSHSSIPPQFHDIEKLSLSLFANKLDSLL